MKHHKQGFTLVELLVVIAIMGILLTFGLSAMKQVTKNANENGYVTSLALLIKEAASYATSHQIPVRLEVDAQGNVNALAETPNGDQNISENGTLKKPQTVQTNFGSGTLIRFGRAGISTINPPNPIIINAGDRHWNMNVSTIGQTLINDASHFLRGLPQSTFYPQGEIT